MIFILYSGNTFSETTTMSLKFKINLNIYVQITKHLL